MSSESNRKAIVGAVVIVLAIIGGAVAFDQTRQAPEETALAAQPAAEPAAPAGESPETAEDVAATAPEAAPDISTEPVEIAPMAPAIDTFFRNPNETTIIAGRATPGQTIAIMLGGEEIDRVVTDGDGTFGAIVLIAADPQPRRLRLIGDPDGDQLASSESVIIPPSEPLAVASAPPVGGDTPEIAAADATEGAPVTVDDTTGRVVVTADVNGGTAPDVSDNSPLALNPEASVAPDVSAPPILIADDTGVRVLQRVDPETTKPAFIDNIALDTITYDTQGEVILAGRAEAGGFVQVYLDNQPITTSRITADGDWQIDLPDVDTGVYTLRVDELDDAGNVQSRIETPFKREEPEAVAAIMAEDTSQDGFDVAVRTVQPGATLWAIAEEQFGSGIKYVAVFEANRDQIRDPDLIYPGQVFRLPEVAE